MNHSTILVIDDSVTIRKLVDTHLSSAGFRVALAADATEGLRLAQSQHPDLVLLDHQLPGTTGYEICRTLSESPQLRDIPVVVSSTLRKKAYAAYIDLDNVVDMLPKPYTEDLLLTTITNALETAAMVVNCQTRGTSAPEVLRPIEDEALVGSFSLFGLREVIDFLNNGRKAGVLEIEINAARIRLHLDRGRIQGVDALGVDATVTELLLSRLPSSLASLGPVLRLTVGGRSCAELDGFVHLLDQKVLDPRLMSRLLRYQAALLLRVAFTRQLKQFRFSPRLAAHGLHKNLPLDISLLALLVEGAIHDFPTDPPVNHALYARRVIRGQNLDRTGLSAQHLRLLTFLAEPQDAYQLAAALGWELEEVHRILDAFITAELVEIRTSHLATDRQDTPAATLGAGS